MAEDTPKIEDFSKMTIHKQIAALHAQGRITKEEMQAMKEAVSKDSLESMAIAMDL